MLKQLVLHESAFRLKAIFTFLPVDSEDPLALVVVVGHPVGLQLLDSIPGFETAKMIEPVLARVRLLLDLLARRL